MYRREQLEKIGRSAAEQTPNRSEWIHRRVEKVTFPLPQDPVYRRHVSIDFTIPDVEAISPSSDDGRKRYYVPLSFLRKWPPLLRLDLRTGDGSPIPLLTAEQNGVADASLLIALAEATLAPQGLALDAPTRRQITELATQRGLPAERALVELLPPQRLGTVGQIQMALRADRVFTEIAGGLRDNTLLWLRVEGRPGDREIVKFSYDIPMRSRVRSWSRAAFGLRPFEARWETPHIGNSGSYHLIISLPGPLRASDGQIVIAEPRTPEGEPKKKTVVAVCDTGQGEVEEPMAQGPLQLYAQTIDRDARFYVHGERAGALGEAWVAILAEKPGFIRGSAMAGALITGLIVTYAVNLDEALAQREAAAAVLLVVPALLAYLIVRPAEHAIVGQFLIGLRRCLSAAAMLPLIGATALVVNGPNYTRAVSVLFWALVAAAGVLTAVLLGGAVLPTESRARSLTRKRERIEQRERKAAQQGSPGD